MKYGRLGPFNEAMAGLIPIFEGLGWELLGAYSTLIGDIHEVTDIWAVPDANAVGEVRLAARSHPEYLTYAPALADLLDSEVISVTTKVPYSP
ncbi:hypothetical protein GB882_07620 [Georgenia ruanii]|uniref:NIPSNAP domain-containing protein n=1 Tax=Georgenia ruanii TaxID=348442 RepID=A0A7J9UVZ0_9MICO|nr:hypothetical protein [Georgenia ruanii]